MIRQTIKFAIRSFRKSTLLHLLNLTGLTIGLTVFFLVSLYVYQEKSYESDFSKKENIFQIGSEMQGMEVGLAVSTPNLTFIVDEIPEAQAITSFTKGKSDLTIGNNTLTANAVIADAYFLNVFDFKLVIGDASKVLSKSSTVILTEAFATQLFGSHDVVGEMLSYNGEPYFVSGVIEKPNYKTQMNIDAIIRPSNVNKYETKNWTHSSQYVYARINELSRREDFAESIDRVVLKYLYPQVKNKEPADLTIDEWRDDPAYRGLFIESLEDLRTESKSMLNMMPRIDQSRMSTMIIVGIAALLISVINFVNLSTAKATVRFKEVGVKRILGANSSLLIAQFLIEAFIIVSLAAVIALGAVELVIKWSADFDSSFVDFSVLHFKEWLIGAIIFIVGLTLVSAVYPALYLSNNKSFFLIRKGLPTNELSVFNAVGFRKVATVIQFAGSISLIVSVIVMFMQISFLGDRDLGYDDEGVLTTNGIFYLSNPIEGSSTIDALENELSKSPLIEEFGFSSRLPMDGVNYIPMPLKGNDGNEHHVVLMGANLDFLRLMKFRLLEGETFSGSNSSKLESKDNESSLIRPVLINEMTAKVFGLQEPIGKLINDKYEVIGVVEDFFFSDLRRAVDPIIILESKPSTTGYLSIRAKDQLKVKALIEEEIHELAWAGYPERTIQWETLESNYAEIMKEENKGFYYMLLFSLLAVFVSCLGLFGLAVFTVDQRFHEFGIRKVLGASVTDIVQLFSKDFAKLVAIAFVIAIPISVYGMQAWLEGFANRISLSLEVFIFTALITIIIVFSTILFQSLKAGRLNPVETLRNE